MKKFMILMLFLLASKAHAQIEADFLDIDDLTNYIENEKSPDTQSANAEESAQTGISENQNSKEGFLKKYFSDNKEAMEAQIEAGNMLDQQPNILELRDSQKRLIKKGEQKRSKFMQAIQKVEDADPEKAEEKKKTELEQKIELIKHEHEVAPFGLYWGINKEETEILGFTLQSAERKDYQNVYKIDNPKQNIKTFDIVTAIFGEQDKLWCIFAQSAPQKDTPQASEVLALYRKYYDALALKYGNAKQYYTPNTYTEELADDEEDKSNKKPVIQTNAIGNDNFLEELQNGTAVLYATFENDNVGITLGVSVDGNSQSYISLDYKNLKIMEEEVKTKLNNLISDI